MWDQIDDLDICLAKLFLEITIFIVFFSPRKVILLKHRGYLSRMFVTENDT